MVWFMVCWYARVRAGVISFVLVCVIIRLYVSNVYLYVVYYLLIIWYVNGIVGVITWVCVLVCVDARV